MRDLTPTEKLMVDIEADPRFRSAFAVLTFLDSRPDLERLQERLAAAAVAFPRLRERITDGRWVRTRSFDVTRHVRQVEMTRKWAPVAVRRQALSLLHTPFPDDRPPWEFVVIVGPDTEKAALLWKLHHAITDGEGGVKLSATFLDAEADARTPLIEPKHLRSDREPEAEAAGVMGQMMGAARQSVGAARWMAGQALLARGRAGLWTDRSLDRGFETLRRPLGRTKQAAHELGVSVNDVLVTACTRGATRLHLDAGLDPARYRMVMPVSTRGDGTAGGNVFSPTVVDLPAGVDVPVDLHAAQISAALNRVKGAPAVGLLDQMAGLANRLPKVAVREVLNRQISTVDFATSNVRAAPFELYVAGARVSANYPIGPLMGAAWNLTLMSYQDSLDMGVHYDRSAVPDGRALVRAIAKGFDEVLGR